jgi:hypothetical protein
MLPRPAGGAVGAPPLLRWNLLVVAPLRVAPLASSDEGLRPSPPAVGPLPASRLTSVKAL